MAQIRRFCLRCGMPASADRIVDSESWYCQDKNRCDLARLVSALRSHAAQEPCRSGACVVCALVEKRAATMGWSSEANIPAGLFVADEAAMRANELKIVRSERDFEWAHADRLEREKVETAELLHDLTGKLECAKKAHVESEDRCDEVMRKFARLAALDMERSGLGRRVSPHEAAAHEWDTFTAARLFPPNEEDSDA